MKSELINLSDDWKQGLAIQEFPANAYGSIQFVGNTGKNSKYVRMGDKTEMAAVKELLTEHWRLTTPSPHLVLSIIGGAKNFHLDGRRREIFKVRGTERTM